MFKLFLKLYSRKLGEYLLRANLEVTVDQLDEGNRKYLKKLSNEKQLHEIIHKLKASVVKAGMAAQDVRNIQRRNDWMQAFDFLLSVINTQKLHKENKVNPLTNKPLEKDLSKKTT